MNEVLCEKRGAVLWLTINRPEQCNAYMSLMISRMPLTEDAREGMAAFGEKRLPQWTGR